MRPALAVPAGLVLAAAGTVGYAAGVERTSYRLRRFEVPVLAPGSEPLRILHISDVHMTAGQTGKAKWLRELARLTPDLVVTTGDNLAGTDAVPAVLHAYEPLFAFPGAFVLGSNDYYAPRPKNPFKYFFPGHKRVHGDPLPWRDLRDAMAGRGWLDLTNRRTTSTVDGRRLELAGLDDPHLKLDRYADVAGPADPTADLHLGLVHAPEPRVLDRFVADGFALLLCGHTHGGQLRVPGYGALVTNCGIDRARARWLSRYDAAGRRAWLHVSAGLGTSPYAPVRFASPPEATLLTLVAG